MTPCGILDVEPDAQAPEEDGDGGQQPHRPREGRVEGAAAEADPRGADREVRKRRRPQRGRAEHVALIEAPQREPERHEREQVQRVPGAQAPPVDQAEDEDDAERSPGPPRVQDLPAERADPAPGHAPGHLRAGPGLDHAAVGIGDLPERDLAGTPRPDLHLPQARGLVERRIRLRIRRVAVEPVRHLRIGEEALEHTALVEAGTRRGGRDDSGTVVVAGLSAAPAAGASSSASATAHADAPHRRKDQSLLPTKLSGVTRMIAIACEKICRCLR